jgi:sigma-E factor negative regulatory protein RseB
MGPNSPKNNSKMGRAMRIKRNTECFGWLIVALAAASVAMAEEPHEWLERMNQALTTRNYDGVFQHSRGVKVETLRIIHRVKNGEVTERLVSLDGSGREFIRTGTELACYLPDQRKVLIEKRADQSLLLGSLPTFEGSQSDVYEITGLKRTRLMGRTARFLVISPKDEYRYGYRLWIDESTAMPLKTQLCDSRGQVIEQVVFASLTLPSQIPDSAFKPDMSTEGFEWLRNSEEPGAAPNGPNTSAPPALWSALRLPPGFRMTARGAQVMRGSRDPVAHLVFTDGIASVSVFVESRQKNGVTQRQIITGTARVGSSSAFSTVVDGHQITAVGEVPPATVQFIAKSVKAEQQLDSRSPNEAEPRGLSGRGDGGLSIQGPSSSQRTPLPAPTPIQGPPRR